MARHADLTSVHRGAYVGPEDPGAVGSQKLWVDTSSGPPYALKVRTAANDGWEDIGGTDALPTASAVDLGDANAEGNDTAFARADHVHKRTVRVAHDGTDVGTRNRLNVTGAGATVTDDPANDQVVIDISASGGGGGGMTNPMTTRDDLIVGGTSGAPVRLAKGTNGQVLTLDGSGHVAWAAPAGGSGSGDAVMAPIVPPPSSGWSWVNQGSATTSRINNAEVIAAPGAGSNQFRARYQSLPSGPYTLTALIAPTLLYKNSLTAGLCLRESSSGKLMLLGFSVYNTMLLLIGKYNSESSYNSNYLANAIDLTPTWFRIQDDGTDRICSFSADGRAFVEIYRVGRTDFLTPDQVGFGVDPVNSGGPDAPGAISLISWDGLS